MPYADSNGVKIHYEDVGDGPVVVCLPGWCSDAEQFRSTTKLLASTHRVIVVDWRGHGGSDPAPTDFGHPELTDDAAAVIAAAGVDTFVVMAAAHAGFVALELRRRFGARVAGIVSVDWMVLGPPPPFHGALAALQEPGAWENVREQVFALWTDGHRHSATSRYVREHMAQHGFEMWARAAREIALAFEQVPVPLSAFAALTPSARFIHVYGQPADPGYLDAQRQFAAQNEWFDVERIDGVTHFPTIEAPERVIGVIRHLAAAQSTRRSPGA